MLAVEIHDLLFLSRICARLLHDCAAKLITIDLKFLAAADVSQDEAEFNAAPGDLPAQDEDVAVIDIAAPSGPLSVMRSAARPTDGAETVHVPACLRAFLAAGRGLCRLASGGFRISRRSWSCRISCSAATRG